MHLHVHVCLFQIVFTVRIALRSMGSKCYFKSWKRIIIISSSNSKWLPLSVNGQARQYKAIVFSYQNCHYFYHATFITHLFSILSVSEMHWISSFQTLCEHFFSSALTQCPLMSPVITCACMYCMLYLVHVHVHVLVRTFNVLFNL